MVNIVDGIIVVTYSTTMFFIFFMLCCVVITFHDNKPAPGRFITPFTLLPG